MLDLAALLVLAGHCAPAVAPGTLLPIIEIESRFDPLAIGVNAGPRPVGRPADGRQAVRIAKHLVAAGGSVDLGLGQINSSNLGWLRLSVEEAFDPCTNLNAAARILAHNFHRAAKTEPDPQSALRTALSLYNTGHPRRGIQNGYVARIEAAALRLRPLIDAVTAGREAPLPTGPAAVGPAPYATEDVFGRAAGPALVFDRQATFRADAATPHGETR
jgi:type IV secretion system protein VirB1